MGISLNASAEENLIPSWVKNNAGWWAEGTIDDDSFIQGIQFLINTGAIIVPEMENLKMENAELQERNKVQEEGIRDLIDERVELTNENMLLKQLTDELSIALAESQVLIHESIDLYESLPSPPESVSTGLSGQSIPESLWGSVSAEYSDNRYDRINVKIHTSDKYENDFVFEVGRVDVLVWYEEEREDIACAMEGGRGYYSDGDAFNPGRFYCFIPDNDGDGNRENLDIIVPVDVVAIEHTIEFSESDYSYDNKLVFEIEGCLPAEDYFVRASIFSDMGYGFTLNDSEFTVDSGSC